MTDKERSCKAICDSTPCKMICTKAKCYLAGLKAGRKDGLDALICEQEHVEMLEKDNTELKKDKEWLDDTNNEQTKVILKLQEQIESLTETLRAISTDTNEHITHNVAQNELDKWELKK